LATAYGEQLSNEGQEFHYTGLQAPDLNLDRIPNWGRIQETFGEDPVLAGEMGAAESIGILQKTHIDVIKHFGVYGQETNRKSVNEIIGTNALYDTFLRPFEIATNTVANSPSVPAQREVALMCSYGDLNGQRSCISSTLTSALKTLDFSGLVRSDLDTVTTAPALLRSDVSMIKPLDNDQFLPINKVSLQNRQLIAAAAEKVLTVMFEAGLVNSAQIKFSDTTGSINPPTKIAGHQLALELEQRGAVLLKDGTGVGSLPMSSAYGPVAIIAPVDLYSTCHTLAKWLGANGGISATCTLFNERATPTTTLLSDLPAGSFTKTLVKSVVFVAPTSGQYLLDNTTFGQSSVTMNGAVVSDQPGIEEIYAPNYTTLNLTKGQKVTFTERWQSDGPILTIAPLGQDIATAVAGLKGAKSALVLGNDFATEGLDRDELNLPWGTDSIIAAVAAKLPTSVALLTSGPVVMPWINSVDSVLELWNPVGNPPIDPIAATYVPAYGNLLIGNADPSGRLPITFPADQDESPMSMGTGPQRFAYWPGINETSNLTLSPINGTVIGYGWYVSEGWPVLFPFGYGLSYATYNNTLDPSTACATANSMTSICLNVHITSSHLQLTPNYDPVEVYVNQPTASFDPRPTMVLGGFDSVGCGGAFNPTVACAGADTSITITANDVGAWNQASSSYQFLTGCYNFITASSEAQSYSVLNDPSAYPGQIEHATAPFSSATTLSAGACS
jgi:beta-glucosidase